MYQLYDFKSSGNGYKVRLLLTQLGIPFEYHETNILEGASRTDAFLEMNSNGKIPILVLEDGQVLSESNAILCFLAEGTSFMPEDRLERARVLQWLFWEQYSHEPYIATSRYWLHYCDAEEYADKIADRREGGLKALGMMEEHLADNDWFVGGRYTIADIALYAYTHVSDEGNFPLDDYPAIRAWLARVKEQSNHVAMSKTN